MHAKLHLCDFAARACCCAGPDLDDGSAKYSLLGFISHQGRNTGCGHYVCHIKKDGRWVIFNDEKVAVSQKPPRELAYMYLYRRDT